MNHRPIGHVSQTQGALPVWTGLCAVGWSQHMPARPAACPAPPCTMPPKAASRIVYQPQMCSLTGQREVRDCTWQGGGQGGWLVIGMPFTIRRYFMLWPKGFAWCLGFVRLAWCGVHGSCGCGVVSVMCVPDEYGLHGVCCVVSVMCVMCTTGVVCMACVLPVWDDAAEDLSPGHSCYGHNLR